MDQLTLFGKPRLVKRVNRYGITAAGEIVDSETGDIKDPARAAEALIWHDSVPDGPHGMPAHQYLVFAYSPNVPDRLRKDLSGVEQGAVHVLLAAIEQHPDGYDAYFRGYQRPMHYLELDDERRYWRTTLHGTHMLNRCFLWSVEPPRRVDEGAQPLPWVGPPWGVYGSPWPPGYVLIGNQWVYNPRRDWRVGYHCRSCRKRFYPWPAGKDCPQCGLPSRAPDAAPIEGENLSLAL